MPPPCDAAPYAGNAATFVPDVDLKSAVEVLKRRERDVERYAYIMEQVWKVDVSQDEDFQRVFNAFYRVRRDEEWRKIYFEMFEKVKQNPQSRFDRTLEELSVRVGTLEPSFVSKMLATVDINEPIWDANVLAMLGLKPCKKSGKYRPDDIYDCYNTINHWYYEFKKLSVAKKWIKAFDRALPEHQDISATKKIDFILWAGGMNYNDHFVPAKGHSWDGGTVTKAATYTETGIKTFKCKECDETRTEEIPSLDKTYHIKSVVAPTCTAEGYTIYECNEVPGLTYKGDYKAKLPHAYDAGKVTKPATIYEKGIKTFTCTSCGTTYTEDIPMVEKTWHKGNTVAPTCTEQGYTVYICDQDSALTEKRDYTNALGHAWDAGTVTTAATCTNAGVKTYTCTRNGCSETKTEEIAALGHKWDDGTVTKAATCEAPGVKTFKCQNTGCTETKTEEIAALGHKWDDGTVTKAPTCTEDGVKTFTCLNDATHTYTEVVPATGHAWDDGVVTKEATYEEDGERTYTCQNDMTHVHKEVIPALGYTFTETVIAPTCTEDGYTLHTCNENPAKTYKDTPVPALGHQYKEVTTPATCGALGSVDNVCERCNDKQHVSDIPATGEHQWDEAL